MSDNYCNGTTTGLIVFFGTVYQNLPLVAQKTLLLLDVKMLGQHINLQQIQMKLNMYLINKQPYILGQPLIPEACRVMTHSNSEMMA